MDFNTLRDKFHQPGTLEITPGEGGLPRLTVISPVSTAEIYLHGAHVTQFTPRGEPPLMFMSRKSHYVDGKPIRGGVPLIFPWFGPNLADPKLPAHGFIRTRAWKLESVTRGEQGAVAVRLTLAPDAQAREIWPREFALAFTVTVGATLEMAMSVTNTGDRPFRFEEAMHTYLAVSDIRNISIDGLAGRTFIDKMDHAAHKTQPSGPFGITGETDRVYLNTPDTVVVTDPAGSSSRGPRMIAVSKQGSASTVVWNPWIAKAAAMADFGDDEWPGMLCIETANAADNALSLEPGQSHTMSATIALL
ncbi:D-hexose-6-phosphate mutarotase [Humisphaera borealis]|uniref:Putative glucose-6-phosphate 1-epimerase n=1 Tax=Humisphaera borealis TaxID=2807512 RepID=A0A7M2WSU5_9BACT|nr:D-hexose-6-phosphate mutarotase [Humisphaera borealis]QOV88252.1 D-hexose-6-phosphate mutarotase [Humisphaera borealis]